MKSVSLIMTRSAGVSSLTFCYPPVTAPAPTPALEPTPAGETPAPPTPGSSPTPGSGLEPTPAGATPAPPTPGSSPTPGSGPEPTPAGATPAPPTPGSSPTPGVDRPTPGSGPEPTPAGATPAPDTWICPLPTPGSSPTPGSGPEPTPAGETPAPPTPGSSPTPGSGLNRRLLVQRLLPRRLDRALLQEVDLNRRLLVQRLLPRRLDRALLQEVDLNRRLIFRLPRRLSLRLHRLLMKRFVSKSTSPRLQVAYHLTVVKMLKREWDAYGLVLSAAGGRGSRPRLFDTAFVGNDPDLGSPNEKCTPSGPGEGEGGEPGSEGENCKFLGNVLIIQTSDESITIPDDNVDGGSILFEFKSPVLFESLSLLDMDYASYITILTETDAGEMNELPPIDVELLGDNSFQTVDINVENVKQVIVSFTRSGAVTDIAFCYPSTEPTPVPPTPASATPAPPSTNAPPTPVPATKPTPVPPTNALPTPAPPTKAPPTPVPATKPTPVPPTPALPTPVTPTNAPPSSCIYINAGGPDYLDPEGITWKTDEGTDYFTPISSDTFSTTKDIKDTDKPGIYQTERYASELRYNVDLVNGEYFVYLHFAEIYRKAFEEGARVMDVFIEGDLVALNLDVYKAAGGANTAYILSVPNVIVDDGSLTIDFVGVEQNAKISAIEICSPSDSPAPSASPSESPSESPSYSPSESPSESPSYSPSASPSESPSESPTGYRRNLRFGNN